MMFGGWLFCLCMYIGVLFGFMYSLCSPVLRSIIVMSKKSTMHIIQYMNKVLILGVSLGLNIHNFSSS